VNSREKTGDKARAADVGKQAYVLYLRIEQYREDLQRLRIAPVGGMVLFQFEKSADENVFKTALNEFNALLGETKRLLEEDPDLSPELVRLVPAGATEAEAKQALGVSSKEQLFIWSGRLLAIVKAYVMFHAPMEEKRKIGFV